ncbi:MAG: MFS transporter [Anaerolineae bacterium]|nr:MFS transporter [Anaerolineae bacterium]
MDRRRLIPIFIIVFVNFLGGTIVLPVLPLYATGHFGASPEAVTLLIASFFAAQFLAGPLLGRLSDQHGRVPVLLISQIGTVISFIMIGTAQSLAMLFAARILDGITGGNVIVAQAYVTDITPREKRTRALGLIFAAFGLGFIFGPAMGGLLARYFGETSPFYVGAAISLLTVILTAVTLDESLTAEERLARREQSRKLRVQDVTGNFSLILLLGIAFIAQFSFSLFQSTFALYSEQAIFPTYSVDDVKLGVGLMLTAIGVGQFMTQIVLIQRLVSRLGERWLVALGAGLRAFGLLSLLLLDSPWLIGAVSLLAFAVGSGLMMPSLQSLTTVTVSDDLRGGVLGVYNSATSLGIITGSAISGVLFAFDHRLPYIIGGSALAFTALAGLVHMRLRR